MAELVVKKWQLGRVLTAKNTEKATFYVSKATCLFLNKVDTLKSTLFKKRQFAKERQWMTAQMQMHIREVNSMFADERKKVRERYKEYDGCDLGHYAQWFFWSFFTIGIVITFTIIFLLFNSFYDWMK